MSICRTCLSKNDLKPIFPDKTLVIPRSKQLSLVCGIEIEENDGLSQLICGACSNLVCAALKLRQLSAIADEKLKKSFSINKIQLHTNNHATSHIHTNSNTQINNIKPQTTKNNRINIKKFSSKKFNNSKHEYTICIEDFESSNDSELMNNFLIDEVESIPSGEESNKVCIEDYESSGSCDFNFKEEEFKQVPFNWDLKEKELLEREERKFMCKEQDQKLLSLAVTPYDSGGPIRCSLCGKEMRNLQNFKCHAKTHFEPQNACEECGKKFVTPSHMRYHQQRMHGRRKRLACARCSYRAVDSLQLQNHERAEHTGERPYICDVCGDTFRMRANIAQHMRKHFGVRNLQCERCPAMFRSRSELTGHQNRVHYLVYTYLCYLCSESYKRPASVKKHLVNVHGVPRSQQLPIKCLKSRRRSSENSD